MAYVTGRAVKRYLLGCLVAGGSLPSTAARIMFKKRDIPPVLLLLLLIILVMLTLSQILVVHNGRYGKNIHNLRRLQIELRDMDANLHTMMLQNVPSIELNRRLIQNELNAKRVAQIIGDEAAQPDPLFIPGTPFLQVIHGAALRSRFNSGGADLQRAVDPWLVTGANDSKESDAGIEFDNIPRTEGSDARSTQSRAVNNDSGTSDGTKTSNRFIGDGENNSAAVRVNISKSTDSSGLSLETLTNQSVSSISIGYLPLTNEKSLLDGQFVMRNSEMKTGHNISPKSFSLANGSMEETLSAWFGSSINNNITSQEYSSLPHPLFVAMPSSPNISVIDRSLENSSSDVMNGVLAVGSNAVTPVWRDGKRGGEGARESSFRVAGNTSSECLQSSEGKICYCPPVPPGLAGRIFLDFIHTHGYTEDDISRQNPDVELGGQWRPRSCVARHKVAVVIPYRDRREHLAILLSHLHPMLQRQQLDYRIYVIEQSGRYTFNKARIMNIAFLEAVKQYGFQCFVFHDVDLVPEDDRNMYSCPMQPRHMSVAIDEMGYKLQYPELVGGVLNMRTEHFQRVNGYSNLYWGWGAEDDDMAYRIMHVGLRITRPTDAVARYKMIRHTKRKPTEWRKRAKLVYTATRRFQFDGLNNLQYTLISNTPTRLYTHIIVDIGKPPRGF